MLQFLHASPLDETPKRVLMKLPGRRTTQNLVKAGWPPPIAWMRTAMRLAIAALLLASGYTHAAQIVLVLSVVNLAGAVELQISKVVMETWHSGLDLLKRRMEAEHVKSCSVCLGRGTMPLPDDCDDDNCCIECAGTGRALCIS